MREILFRGKRTDNDEWLISKSIDQWDDGRVYLFDEDEGNCIEVSPETVGQFTGMYDKNGKRINGKRIFEGDIVTYGNQNYMVKWDDINARFICISEFSWNVHRNKYTKGQGNTLCYLSSVLEVIGNIHDNPELLEEK